MTIWLAIITARIAGLFRARALDDEFDRELASHLEMAVADNIRRGMTSEVARRTAALQIGGPTQLKEQIREHRGVPMVDTILQDVRYGLRMLRRFPAFSVVAVATLAVGIGASTVVFSFERAVLLRPLPYLDPSSLVRIHETTPLTGPRKVAPANWADWRARNTAFTEIAAYEQFNDVGSGAGDLFLTGFGEPQGLKALGVSGNLFTVLGTSPLMGRLFVDDETYEGNARVAILSYGLWRSTFAGDPGIIGRTITLSGRNYEVVGVMPRSFVFPGPDVQLWTPLGYTPARIAQSRRPHWLGVVARIRPGVTLEHARQAMGAVARSLESVGLLFVIVCVNIANLQLASEAGSADGRRLQTALVAGEVALSIILVVTAVLLLRSLSQLRSIDPGFNADDALAFTVTLPSAHYPNSAADLLAFRAIERRLAELPGTDAVGATSTLPLRGFTWTGSTTVEGRGAEDYERETRHASTTTGYFSAMGIRLLAGRWFTGADVTGAPEVAIVNEALARRYFPGVAADDIVGKRLSFGRPQDKSPWVEIVGVVSDEKQRALDEIVQPNIYSHIGQRMQNPLTFVVRSRQNTSAVMAGARTAIAAVDKDLAMTSVAPLRQVVESATDSERFRATLLLTFAGTALLLAGLGIYGVLAYFVSQRTRELGIRLALGASPSALFLAVVGQGLRPVVAGGLVGIVASALITRLAESLLFGVQPLDLPTYATAIVALAIIALAACAVPAFRATTVDPQIALRNA